jgi:hypothetical protein
MDYVYSSIDEYLLDKANNRVKFRATKEIGGTKKYSDEEVRCIRNSKNTLSG